MGESKPMACLFLVVSAVLVVAILALRGGVIPVNCFRFLGIILEATGLMTVLLSLAAENRNHEKSGFHRRLGSWMCAVRDIFRVKHASVSVGGAIRVAAAFSPEGHVRLGKPDNASVEMRLDVVEHELNSIYKLIHQHRADEHSVIEKIRQDLHGLRDQVAKELAL